MNLFMTLPPWFFISSAPSALSDSVHAAPSTSQEMTVSSFSPVTPVILKDEAPSKVPLARSSTPAVLTQSMSSKSPSCSEKSGVSPPSFMGSLQSSHIPSPSAST